jgi:hypothetical protein
LYVLSPGVGFGALALSEFETVRMLGLATSATLLIALLADVLLLPSLLVLLRLPRREKDLAPVRTRRRSAPTRSLSTTPAT